MVKKKLKQKVTLTDDSFLSRYFALDEHRSDLARELGISPAAVTQRLRRLGLERIEQARDAGRAAVVIAKALEQKPQHTPQQVAFNKGVEDAITQYHVFDGLEDLYGDIKGTLNGLKEEISQNKTGKAKAFQIDQICKLVSRAESLTVNAHKLKIDMVKAEGTESFFRCMIEIFKEEVPDVRQRLYTKLARYGLEGQISLGDGGFRSGPGCHGDSCD